VETNDSRPWLGPDSYSEHHESLFKGRGSERDDILRLLEREILTTLFGASGLGKTSLLRAAVFPELRKREMLPVEVRLDHDESAPPLGEQILQALRAAATLHQIEGPEPVAQDRLWQHFHREGHLYWTRRHHVITPVVVLDQFEEIFTRGQQSEACSKRSQEFLTELADLIEDREPLELQQKLEQEGIDAIKAGYVVEPIPLKVIISLREDFLAPLEQLRELLPSLGRNRMRLTALTLQQAREVVELPAAPQHLLAEGVADQILQFVSAADRSPTAVPTGAGAGPTGKSTSRNNQDVDPALLSIFCYELNNRRLELGQDQITSELLASSQEQILVSFYERAFDGVAAAVRRFVEEELISPSGFRDSRALDDALNAPGVNLEALNLLVSRRLLRYEEQRSGNKRIELQHDVFLRVAENSRAARLLVERRNLKTKELIRRVWATIVIAIPVLAALGTLAYHYLYVWHYEAFFASFVSVRGEPRGVGQLRSDEMAKRPVSLRIVRQGRIGHTVSMDVVDASGRLTPDHAFGTYFGSEQSNVEGGKRGTGVSWRYGYDASGRLLYEIMRDCEQRVVWSFIYAPSSKLDAARNEVRIGQLLGERGLPVAGLNGFVELTYAADTGFEVRARYLDQQQRPIPGRDKAYGQRWEYDDDGNGIAFASLDEQGQPMNSELGYATLRMEVDARGESLVETAFDAAGTPTTTIEGWTVRRLERDSAGNILAEAYFKHREGKLEPTLSSDGYHKRTVARDHRGEEVGVTFMDTAGKPTPDLEGCYGYRFKDDARGNVSERTCVDAGGRPVEDRQGCAITKYHRDAWGDMVESQVFDAVGQPALLVEDAEDPAGSPRYHSIKYNRDERGRQTEARFHDTTGKPLAVAGYARRTRQYDDSGNLTSEHYWNAENAPVTSDEGYSRLDYAYDANGRVTEVTYRGLQDRRVLNKAGYSGYRLQYDSRGHETRREFVGVDGARTLMQGGHAVEQSVYDRLGRLTRIEYLDLKDKPVASSGGIAGFNARYDQWGRCIERLFFDIAGRPVPHQNGYAGWRATFDHVGNEIKTEYLDTKGNVSERSSGYAVWTRTYDAWHRETESRYFDSAGKAVVNAGGFAVSKTTYDRQGNTVRVVNADANDVPRVPGSSGCARIESAYDAKRNRLREECFDGRDQPMLREGYYFKEALTHDALGRVASFAYFDARNRPTLTPEGYHQLHREYDGNGNVIHEIYKDRAGVRIESTAGYAELRAEYAHHNVPVRREVFDADGTRSQLDDGGPSVELSDIDAAGQVVRVRYRDKDSMPFVNGEGYASRRFEYDLRGRKVAESFLGAKDEPVRIRAGYARHEMTYGEDGELSEEKFLNLDGRLVAIRGGVARLLRRTQRVEGKKVTEVSLFGADGRPVIAEFEGRRFAIRRVITDPYERVVEETYLDLDGRSRVQVDRCGTWRREYDRWGNPEMEACFVNEQKALSDKNVHATAFDYNVRGQVVSETNYGLNENRVVSTDGYARRVHAYDDRGNLETITTFNEREEPIAGKLGYATITRRYDPYDTQIEVSYTGADGQPFAFEGTARRVMSYDAVGNQIALGLYDAKGEKLVSEERYEYDNKGQRVRVRFFKDGEPTPANGSQVYVVHLTYDSLGREISRSYSDKSGKPVRGFTREGAFCGQWLTAYDENGKAKNTCNPVPSTPDAGNGVIATNP
jgi:YD repeat-containing protein